ncbi:MAG: hypothetical protein R3272_11225 [Candidatus Promineifilaceae bacterium]|nr:hypothetical protein [Candidatus Promineifilaceae bacterium]
MSAPGPTSRPSQAKAPNRYVPLAVLVLVVVLLSLLIRNFFTRAILTPLFDTILGIYALYRSLPQNVLWALLVLAAAAVAVRALWPSGGWRLRERRLHVPQGQMERLAELITLAPERTYARWQLAHQLRETLLALLARESGISRSEIHGRAPAEVLELIANLKRAESGRLFQAEAPEAALLAPLRKLLEACAAIPNYGTFLALQQQEPGRVEAVLGKVDVEQTLLSVERLFELPAASG